jgi:hypothetical protein
MYNFLSMLPILEERKAHRKMTLNSRRDLRKSNEYAVEQAYPYPPSSGLVAMKPTQNTPASTLNAQFVCKKPTYQNPSPLPPRLCQSVE